MSESVVLNDAAKADTDFLLYTGNFCGYCTAAKRLLERKGLAFTELKRHPPQRANRWRSKRNASKDFNRLLVQGFTGHC